MRAAPFVNNEFYISPSMCRRDDPEVGHRGHARIRSTSDLLASIKGSPLPEPDCSERGASRSFTPAMRSTTKFLLTWLVVDDRVEVRATEIRECGYDFARLGRFQASQRDDADMPVRFRPNGSLQPLRSLSRPCNTATSKKT